MTSHARTRRRPSLQRRYFIIAAAVSLALFAILVVAINLNLVLTWVVAWTPVTFALYGFDKARARRDGLRVPEINLLAAGALGGFGGALAGMLVFRHKTAKLTFWIVNIASAVAYTLLLMASVF